MEIKKQHDSDTLSQARSPGFKPQGVGSDAERLEHLGIQGELDRSFSLPSLIGLCLCLMGTWEACSSVVAQALTSGGVPCLLIATFLCSIAVGASLGEIASIYPTAGGQYHWVAALFPDSGRKTAAWVTGWISIGGQIVMTASVAFACGLMTQGLIVLNVEGYIPTRWQAVLIYWAFLLYAAAMNIWCHRLLPTASLISGILHVVCFVAIFIALAVMAPKNSASFVFTETYNRTGWPSDGVAWLVGLISTVYPFLGYDAAYHLAEELPHASRNVPLAMLGSIVTNGTIGLAYVLMLAFSTGSLDTILDTPTGFPFMKIFLDATRSTAGATALVLYPIVVAVAGTVAGVTSTSRTLWVYARDKATPFPGHLSHVNQRARVPVNAIVACLVLQAALGFIYLGNTTAFNAILSMSIIGMYSSYGIPIACMLFNGRTQLPKSEYGPFRFGKIAGPILNIISLVWITAAIIFSIFPGTIPANSTNMNYSIAVMVAWMAFGLAWYAISLRRKFHTPIVRPNVVMGLPLNLHVGG
ncbi:hypothetical protein QQX98_010799 [Neonectria punicea]|uniref:Amino acid permease n=1 Tax=Neonectria punicea TaxID=979145 RepID=A0ABR1GNW3_9HYPO